jgi:hypothetical protein
MNLIGSRSTLIANVCAFVVACADTPAGAFVVHKCLGYSRPQDILGFFLPVLVMFIIRNPKFSWLFLALYIALSIWLLVQARTLYLGTCGPSIGKGDPLAYFGLFLLLSSICLAIYAAFAFINFVASQVGSRR